MIASKTVGHRWGATLNTTSALKLWWIWFVALLGVTLFIGAAYLIAYSGEIVGLAADIFNLGMYAIIVVPGVLAVWYSFHEARFIAEQTQLASQQAELLQQLNELETKVGKVVVPLAYADELYALRNNIQLVRKKLQRKG